MFFEYCSQIVLPLTLLSLTSETDHKETGCINILESITSPWNTTPKTSEESKSLNNNFEHTRQKIGKNGLFLISSQVRNSTRDSLQFFSHSRQEFNPALDLAFLRTR